MRKIDNIVLHCSDSLWGCAREIRKWHMDKGWSDIGYHFVVLNGRPTFEHSQNGVTIPSLEGSIECGRYLDDDTWVEELEVGSHALGLNSSSIGVCMIGKTQFSEIVLRCTSMLIRDLCMLYQVPTIGVIGHYEVASGKAQGKTCPNIDMVAFRGRLEGVKDV